MQHNERPWVNRVGIMVVIVGALLLVSDGLRVSAAARPPSNPGNPFNEILDKLDDLKEAVDALSAGAPPPCGAGTAGQRFVVSPDGTEVCDNTTGLNWQKNPDSTQRTHADALAHCPTVRPSSRLPEVKELISLVDYSVPSPGPVLPAGHPFTNIQSSTYWSATTRAGDPSSAWDVDFVNGDVPHSVKTSSIHAWCVRGA